MAAVDKAKQLKAKCAEQEAALSDAAKVREELGRVQQQLGALHGTCSALKSQLKAAKEHALSQTATIYALFKALDDISAEDRAVRLDLDKQVKRP